MALRYNLRIRTGMPALLIWLLGGAALPAQSPPQIDRVVNTANYQYLPALAGLSTIFGSNLSDGPAYQAQTSPPTTKLGPAEVLACANPTPAPPSCVPAEIFSVSPTQINFRMPPRPLPGNAFVMVRLNGTTRSDPYFLQTFLSSPAIFLMGYDCSYDPLSGDSSPCGLSWTQSSSSQPLRGAVTDAAGALLTAAYPARMDQAYVLWVTGLGIFSNSRPPQDVRLTLSGTPARATYEVKPAFVGPSSQFPGLYQVNFSWPAGLLGSAATQDLQPCGDYRLEVALRLFEGSMQDPNVIHVPLLVRNGDVPCAAN